MAKRRIVSISMLGSFGSFGLYCISSSITCWKEFNQPWLLTRPWFQQYYIKLFFLRYPVMTAQLCVFCHIPWHFAPSMSGFCAWEYFWSWFQSPPSFWTCQNIQASPWYVFFYLTAIPAVTSLSAPTALYACPRSFPTRPSGLPSNTCWAIFLVCNMKWIWITI